MLSLTVKNSKALQKKNNDKLMSKIKTVTWEMEPHTEAKHEILKKYLDAWLPIMSRFNDKILYIDGFAGPGEYTGGKDGSPIIALKSVINHKAPIHSNVVLYFIEADSERCEHLKNKVGEITKPSNVEILIDCKKFEDAIGGILNHLEEQAKVLAPSFVFIDPFGFTGIPIKVIKKIMGYSKCEVFITFMYEEINRFISDEKLWDGLTETFGTDSWKTVISVKDPNQRRYMLHNIYRDQLEKEVGIKFVRSFEMKNKGNKTDYFLFFGTNNIKGLQKMKEAMWKIDENGAFQFSDATYNPSQPTLFEAEPNYFQLKNIILKKFKGKVVSINNLERFILIETPFRETHYKKQILAKMEKDSTPEIKRRCDSCPGDCKIIKGNYPHEECLIEFL